MGGVGWKEILSFQGYSTYIGSLIRGERSNQGRQRRERQWRVLTRSNHVDGPVMGDETFSTAAPGHGFSRAVLVGTRDRCVARENLGQMRTYAPSLKCATHCLVFIRRSCRCTCTTCRLEYYTLDRLPLLYLSLTHSFALSTRHRTMLLLLRSSTHSLPFCPPSCCSPIRAGRDCNLGARPRRVHGTCTERGPFLRVAFSCEPRFLERPLIVNRGPRLCGRARGHCRRGGPRDGLEIGS